VQSEVFHIARTNPPVMLLDIANCYLLSYWFLSQIVIV